MHSSTLFKNVSRLALFSFLLNMSAPLWAVPPQEEDNNPQTTITAIQSRKELRVELPENHLSINASNPNALHPKALHNICEFLKPNDILNFGLVSKFFREGATMLPHNGFVMIDTPQTDKNPSLTSIQFTELKIKNDHTLAQIIKNNYILNVKKLIIIELNEENKSIKELIKSGKTLNITSLSISNSKLNTNNIKLLGESDNFPKLKHLDLSNNHTGPDVMRILDRRVNLPELETLDLSNNSIGDEGMAIVSRNNDSDKKKIMNWFSAVYQTLNGNENFTKNDIENIINNPAKEPIIKKLKYIKMNKNNITTEGIFYLWSSTYGDKVEKLELKENNISSDDQIKLQHFFKGNLIF